MSKKGKWISAFWRVCHPGCLGEVTGEGRGRSRKKFFTFRWPSAARETIIFRPRPRDTLWPLLTEQTIKSAGGGGEGERRVHVLLLTGTFHPPPCAHKHKKWRLLSFFHTHTYVKLNNLSVDITLICFKARSTDSTLRHLRFYSSAVVPTSEPNPNLWK